MLLQTSEAILSPHKNTTRQRSISPNVNKVNEVVSNKPKEPMELADSENTDGQREHNADNICQTENRIKKPLALCNSFEDEEIDGMYLN